MSKFTVRHKKKALLLQRGGPKQPTTDQIDYGEIAVNYADGYERLFIKNSSNEIIDFKNGEYIDNALNNHNDRITTLFKTLTKNNEQTSKYNECGNR